jgi:trehalose 6-phosphate synthase/phosphatase
MHYILPEYPKKHTHTNDAWIHYQAVNQKFADKIVEEYQNEDISK